ncbi:MAG: M28 family peptidase [Fulvivirga sp.]
MKSVLSNSIYLKSLIVLMTLSVGCNPTTEQINLDEQLKTHVAFLASDKLAGRGTGTAAEDSVVAYVSDQFEKYGLQPAGTEGYLQSFRVKESANPHEQAKTVTGGEGVKVTNVVGLLDNPGDSLIIIGAHHDHLGLGEFGTLHTGDSAIHNGADDNASGVAIVLALASKLSQEELQHDVLFITFSGEERGLWGSNHFSKNPTVDLSKVKAMINLDMVGRLNENKDLVVHGTGTSPSWPDIINNSNTFELIVVMKPSGVGPSDHTSFYLQDIPVLHLFTGQHEDYHKPSDDLEKLNYEGMATLTKYLENITKRIDNTNIHFTKTKDESEDTPRFKVTLDVMPDYLYDGTGMRIDGVSEGETADMAGLKKGDIVVTMGDSTVTDMMSYMRALSAFNEGDTTTVEVLRGDTLKMFKIQF